MLKPTRITRRASVHSAISFFSSVAVTTVRGDYYVSLAAAVRCAS